MPSGGSIAAASGAAFITVVLAQTANAFACRSSTRWPGSLGWTTNRMLLWAVSTGFTFSLLSLAVPGVANLLGQAWPPIQGWLVGLCAIPLLFAVDAADKRVRRRRMSAQGSRLDYKATAAH